jgi:50S ribosomal subunit-associated GTPase HflX
VVLNKLDLLETPRRVLGPPGREAIQVSATTGEGIGALLASVRQRLLHSRGVVILRVPLDRPEEVQRAVNLPHQLARRFRDDVVEVAVRATSERLAEEGLGPFRVEAWKPTDSPVEIRSGG